MSISDSIGSVLKAAILVGFIYVLWTWQFDDSQKDDNSSYAESACVDEIDDRFAATTVKVYDVEETAKGFVVRASVKLPKGTSGKVYCVTNEFGRVKDVRLIER